MCSTPLCTFFFAVVLGDYKVKLPDAFKLSVLWRKYRTCSSSLFFSLPLIFRLHRWKLAFLIFSPPLQNLHVVLPTRKVSFVFYLSLKLPVALFLDEPRWPVAYFVFFSVFPFLYIPNLGAIDGQHGFRNTFPLSVSSLLTL